RYHQAWSRQNEHRLRSAIGILLLGAQTARLLRLPTSKVEQAGRLRDIVFPEVCFDLPFYQERNRVSGTPAVSLTWFCPPPKPVPRRLAGHEYLFPGCVLLCHEVRAGSKALLVLPGLSSPDRCGQ